MKNVVFSEGKNDVYLLTELHERAEPGEDYDYYLTEDADISQTKWLRQHHADGRFNYLYKSEEGDGNLIKQFRSHSLMFTKFALYILVDLDGGFFQDFVEDLNDKLFEDYGNNVQVDIVSTESFGDLCIADAKLKIERTGEKNLPIIAFYDSLEAVADIHDGEGRASKEAKISRYLDNNAEIAEAIESIVYN